MNTVLAVNKSKIDIKCVCCSFNLSFPYVSILFKGIKYIQYKTENY